MRVFHNAFFCGIKLILISRNIIPTGQDKVDAVRLLYYHKLSDFIGDIVAI